MDKMNSNQNKNVAHVNDPDSFVENGILIKNVDPKETCQSMADYFNEWDDTCVNAVARYQLKTSKGILKRKNICSRIFRQQHCKFFYSKTNNENWI